MAKTRTQFGFQLISGRTRNYPGAFYFAAQYGSNYCLYKGLFILASAYIKSIDLRTTFGFPGGAPYPLSPAFMDKRYLNMAISRAGRNINKHEFIGKVNSMDFGTAQKKEHVLVDNSALAFSGKLTSPANFSMQLKWVTSNIVRYDKYSVDTAQYARYLATGAGSQLVPGT